MVCTYAPIIQQYDSNKDGILSLADHKVVNQKVTLL
jgi:hypothetical protein